MFSNISSTNIISSSALELAANDLSKYERIPYILINSSIPKGDKKRAFPQETYGAQTFRFKTSARFTHSKEKYTSLKFKSSFSS